MQSSGQSNLTKGLPLKIAPFDGGSGPHLVHGFLGQSESITQAASRIVRPFFQGLLFQAVLTNRYHVLCHYFQDNRHQTYSLRRRPHNKAIEHKATFLYVIAIL